MPRFTLILVLFALAAAVDAQTPQKAIDNSKWAGLPQEPASLKERSDLEDERVMGRVKTMEYMTIRHEPRKPDGEMRLIRIEEFDERGNRVVTKYVRDGIVASAIFYGYIDGERVSKSEGSAGGMGSGAVDTRPRDSRFEYKRRYKYQNGRLAEEVLISNRNEVWMTYRRNYTARTIERLVYSNDGKLNQRYVHHLDEKGNEIGWDSFDAFKNPNEIRLRARYSYAAFDSLGNWTQRTLSYVSSKDGQESSQPYETTFRKITYFIDPPRH